MVGVGVAGVVVKVFDERVGRVQVGWTSLWLLNCAVQNSFVDSPIGRSS